MNKEYPKISIVTASLNSKDYIKKAIEGVLSQDYPNIEYIIKDGGSTDGTIDIIKAYGDKIKLISEKDASIYEALRQGLSSATGDVFSWLDSDNYYSSPTYISEIAKKIQKKNADVVLSDGYFYYPDTNRKIQIDNKDISFDKLLNTGNLITPESIFFKKSFYEKAGSISTDYKLLSDYELWLKIFKQNPNVSYIKKNNFVYIVRNEALLRKNPYLAWHEGFAIGKKYDRTKYAKIVIYLKYIKERVRLPMVSLVKENAFLYRLYVKMSK